MSNLSARVLGEDDEREAPEGQVGMLEQLGSKDVWTAVRYIPPKLEGKARELVDGRNESHEPGGTRVYAYQGGLSGSP